MKCRYRFHVHAKSAVVSTFHRTSVILDSITPSLFRMRLHQAPRQINTGDEIHFTLHLGILPVYWQALIEDITEEGFIDIQTEGLFHRWEHLHTFQPDGHEETAVVDAVKEKNEA